MNDQVSIPLGGVLRVLYFLALAGALIAFVLSAVTNIYEGPESNSESLFSNANFIGFAQDEDRMDYERNLGAIFSVLGSAIMAFGVGALPRSLNGARAGILGGGAIVFFVGLNYAGSGSNDWLIAVWSLLGVLILATVLPWLEEGGDWALTTFDQLTRRASSPPPPNVPPPSDS